MPDLSFAAYLVGTAFRRHRLQRRPQLPRADGDDDGGFATASPLVLSIAMIWLAHIGFDRALGYGLKYAAGFGFTHLGRIGKRPN